MNEKNSNALAAKVKRMGWKLWLSLIVVAALLAGAGWFVYDYSQVRKENERLSDPQQAAKQATDKLIADVGQLTQLPNGETPTIATVSDVSKLQSQAFFANAQNGDRVLIYTQAKKAYLYRPSTNKIINIAPVNLGNNDTSSSTNSESSTQNSNNNNTNSSNNSR